MYYNTITKKIYESSLDVIKDFPNVSFPTRAWKEEDISEFNLVELQYPDNLVNDLLPYEYFKEVDPIQVDGKWTRAFEKQQKDFSSYNPIDLEIFIGQEKAKILSNIATIRYEKETSSVSIVIDGKDYVFPASRSTQASLINLYLMFKNELIEETVWKFANGDWITINLETIEVIIAAVTSHVQNAFVWEKLQSDSVVNITTIKELTEYVSSNPSNYIL